MTTRLMTWGKVLVFFPGVPAMALVASEFVGGWIVFVVLFAMLFYMAGALMSAWTFLGTPVSMNRL